MSDTHIQQIHDPHEVSAMKSTKFIKYTTTIHIHNNLFRITSIPLFTQPIPFLQHPIAFSTITLALYTQSSTSISLFSYASYNTHLSQSPHFHILHHPLYTFHSPYTLQDAPSTPYLVNIHSRHHYHECHHNHSP